MHQILDLENQLASQNPARMSEGEILLLKSLFLQQDNGQGIAHGQGRGRACRGGKTQRAGLLLDRCIQDHISSTGQGRVGIAGYHDELQAQTLNVGEELQNLIGLAAVGDRQNNIPLHDHSEITVDSIAGMEKKGRGPCAR